jgi:hypothetical protein
MISHVIDASLERTLFNAFQKFREFLFACQRGFARVVQCFDYFDAASPRCSEPHREGVVPATTYKIIASLIWTWLGVFAQSVDGLYGRM